MPYYLEVSLDPKTNIINYMIKLEISMKDIMFFLNKLVFSNSAG